MEDRYLFKAKRIDNGEWVEGAFYIEPYTDARYIIRWNSSGLGFNEFIKVDRETICQCTGLKDKNGKLIWENDVVDRKETYSEIVKYKDGDWISDYSHAHNKEAGSDYCNLGFYVQERKCVEVIGNIFDNPELLESEE